MADAKKPLDCPHRADGGNTWSISDSFSYGGPTVEIYDMTQDAAGNLFVCGHRPAVSNAPAES